MIEVWATTTSPARRAKMTTKSSGRLPRVDCSAPVDRRAEALAHLLGGQRDQVRQAGERDGREREGQQRRPVGVVRDAGQDGRHQDAGDDLHFAAAQPSHGGSEDTHAPHYAARRCSASPWPACATAAASRSAGARGWDAASASTSHPARSSSLGDGCRVGDGCRFHLGAGAAVVMGAGRGRRALRRRGPRAHRDRSRGPPGGTRSSSSTSTTTSATSSVPCASSRWSRRRWSSAQSAVVGAAAGVLRGVTVGEGARVGVRSVVTHDVPPGARAEGTPARVQAPAR